MKLKPRDSGETSATRAQTFLSSSSSRAEKRWFERLTALRFTPLWETRERHKEAYEVTPDEEPMGGDRLSLREGREKIELLFASLQI